jgi:hypothetical protein
MPGTSQIFVPFIIVAFEPAPDGGLSKRLTLMINDTDSPVMLSDTLLPNPAQF